MVCGRATCVVLGTCFGFLCSVVVRELRVVPVDGDAGRGSSSVLADRTFRAVKHVIGFGAACADSVAGMVVLQCLPVFAVCASSAADSAASS